MQTATKTEATQMERKVRQTNGQNVRRAVNPERENNG